MSSNHPSERAPARERLVVAVSQVAGATRAIAAHGDEAMLQTVRTANDVLVGATRVAGGRVVKALGEGLLLTFPASRSREAVGALRSARDAADAVWKAFDPECELQVKCTIGEVLVDAAAYSGDASHDVYGSTLHELFKAKASAFLVLPALSAQL